MKKLLVILLSLSLCVVLTSCGDFDLKAFVKRYLSDEEAVSRDAGYIETKKNDEYEYEVYTDHILLVQYLGDDEVVRVPSRIDERDVTVIGSLCFYYTDGVTSIILPSTVKKLCDSAIYHCTTLQSISLPDSVTSIGVRCFAWCTSLESIIIPQNITEIPDYCFNYCTKLEGIIIPSGITSVGVRAFSWCESLKNVSFESGLASVGDNAFMNSPSLVYVSFPATLAEIGDKILEGCPDTFVVTSSSAACFDYCEDNGIKHYASLEDAETETETSDELSVEESE